MLLGSITTQKEPQQSIEITGVFYQLGCGRVEMWRGGFRFEHICSRLFRLAVPHWLDHGPVSTSRSSVGSRAGAPVWLGGPDPHHVSSPLHVARNVRISRIARPHLLHAKADGTYPVGTTFGPSRRTR